jgi:pimeloyl-ACP methyl ester carboxylesterase
VTTTSAPAVQGRTVQVDDIEMYYEEYGAGEPLLLLHGFGGSGQNWRPFIAQLAERHRLIVVDMRGHGHSTNPGNTFTHRQAAGDVLLLLGKLGITRCSAMGISSGGMVLLHMATSQPQRIDAMVLISATSHFPDQARAIMATSSFERMPRPVQDMYRECAKRGDAQIRALIAQFNAFAQNHDDMNFTAQELATVSARTLVVHGDRDRFFPAEIAETIARSIPNATLWLIPGGDHVPINDPAIPFVSTALRFLDQCSP